MLRQLLRRTIREGCLFVTMPDGNIMRFGNGQDRPVRVVLKDRATALKIALHPDLYLGKCYLDGSLAMEQSSIWDLLDLVGRNLALAPPPRGRVRAAATAVIRVMRQVNARHAAKRNVAHHYDMSETFFRSFLDTDMQYSCGYFRSPGASIDEAQQTKERHIAAKLALAPGLRVLDIGCGWGGMAIHLARHHDVHVHGISLSSEQLAVCRRRVEALGLADRVTFGLTDYRDVRGTFDRIVSVGMLEHVGAPNYAIFFATVARLLAPSGIALVHAIGRSFGPSYTSSFIRRYIFPGGYIPALSQVVPPIERAGLRLTDMEILRLHYAETLRLWRERFLARADVEPRFRRMWEFYLAVSEMSFRHLDFMVFQAQLTRQVDAVPITRDYMKGYEDREGSATPAPSGLAA